MRCGRTGRGCDRLGGCRCDRGRARRCGRAATERLIERSTNAASRILHSLPEAGGLKQMLRDLLQMLMIREA